MASNGVVGGGGLGRRLRAPLGRSATLAGGSLQDLQLADGGPLARLRGARAPASQQAAKQQQQQFPVGLLNLASQNRRLARADNHQSHQQLQFQANASGRWPTGAANSDLHLHQSSQQQQQQLFLAYAGSSQDKSMAAPPQHHQQFHHQPLADNWTGSSGQLSRQASAARLHNQQLVMESAASAPTMSSEQCNDQSDEDRPSCMQIMKKLLYSLLLGLVVAICWMMIIHTLKWIAIRGNEYELALGRPQQQQAAATLAFKPAVAQLGPSFLKLDGLLVEPGDGGGGGADSGQAGSEYRAAYPPAGGPQSMTIMTSMVADASAADQTANLGRLRRLRRQRLSPSRVEASERPANRDDDGAGDHLGALAVGVPATTTTNSGQPSDLLGKQATTSNGSGHDNNAGRRQLGRRQLLAPRPKTLAGGGAAAKPQPDADANDELAARNDEETAEEEAVAAPASAEQDDEPAARAPSAVRELPTVAASIEAQAARRARLQQPAPSGRDAAGPSEPEHLGPLRPLKLDTSNNNNNAGEPLLSPNPSRPDPDLEPSQDLANNYNNNESPDQQQPLEAGARSLASNPTSLVYRAPFFTSWFVSTWNILFMPVFALISSCCFRTEDSTTKKLLVESISQFMDNGLTTLQFLGRCAFFSLLWITTIFGIVYSLAHIDATVVMALFACSAALVYLLSWVLLHQQFVGVRIVAVIICTTGVALLAYMDNSKTLGSVLIVAGSALCSAVYKVIYQRMFGFWSIAQMSLFFTLIGLFNAFLMWPVALLLYFLGVELIVWRYIPWIHLTAAGALHLTANIVAYFGPICSYDIFLTLGLLVAVVFSAVIDVTFYKITFTGMKLAGVLLLMVGFLVCLLPENWNEYLYDLANERFTRWKKQRSMKKNRNKVQDLSTGQMSRLRTPSGRVK